MGADEIPFDPKERPPGYLYKYRSLDGPSFEFVRKLVQESSVWFPNPSDFNDPFDCAPAVGSECTDAEYRNYVKELVRTKANLKTRSARRAETARIIKAVSSIDRSVFLGEIFEKFVPETINRAGVLSLSEKYDDVLMWSHYADSHRGCCLRFKATGDIFQRARRVIYSKNRPMLNIIRDSEGEMMFRSLLVKADFWKYEQEWRVIDYIDGGGAHPYESSSLDGIILGARVSAKARAAVLKWAEAHEPPVQVLHAAFDPKHFRLVIS